MSVKTSHIDTSGGSDTGGGPGIGAASITGVPGNARSRHFMPGKSAGGNGIDLGYCPHIWIGGVCFKRPAIDPFSVGKYGRLAWLTHRGVLLKIERRIIFAITLQRARLHWVEPAIHNVTAEICRAVSGIICLAPRCDRVSPEIVHGLGSLCGCWTAEYVGRL